MSADPVTMMIISGAVQGIGMYSDIQESKRQSKIEQERFQMKIRHAELQGLQQENDRKEEADRTKRHNMAIAAGSGYMDDSRQLYNIQKQVDINADKDVTRIRLNTGAQVSDYSLAAQSAKSSRKAEQFGGWMSIAGTGLNTKAKADAYKTPKTNNTKKYTRSHYNYNSYNSPR